jgi:hypothetical protein
MARSKFDVPQDGRRGEHGSQDTHPPKDATDLPAGDRRRLERLRVPRLGPVISPYVDHHTGPVHEPREVVRQVPTQARPCAVPREANTN